MRKFHKGDRVVVKATVSTRYVMVRREGAPVWDKYSTIIHVPRGGGQVKVLVRHEYGEWEGIVIGLTRRATGHYYAAFRGNGWYYGEYDPAALGINEWHEVWLVEPMEGGIRYRKPVTCLEEDLEHLNAEVHCETVTEKLQALANEIRYAHGALDQTGVGKEYWSLADRIELLANKAGIELDPILVGG